MKSQPKIGEVGQFAFTVAAEHLIDFAGNGMPAILCSPVLMRFMERSAREALAPHLNEGEVSLGVRMELEHLAATPLGDRVTCKAKIINTDGSLISFQWEAHDSRERIATGLHERRVIDIARFARRLARKTEQ